jgi:SAM-dependent methyltransferase
VNNALTLRGLAEHDIATRQPSYTAVHVPDFYPGIRAHRYAWRRQHGLKARLQTWAEQRALRRALAWTGSPQIALDLACGTGRFWPVFRDAGVRDLIAADASAGMLTVAAERRIGDNYPQRLLQTSAFQIDLPDSSVDFAACLRFYHHLAMPEDRLQVLTELRRVSSGYFAVSLLVDGNVAGELKLRAPQPPVVAGFGRRRCRRRCEVEAEFSDWGFRVARHFDALPGVDAWRLYLLT